MTIDPSLLLNSRSLTPSTSAPSTTNPKGVLGKNDFLKLLVTQLKTQDPMAPMKDEQFISQMATFTSLEQTQNMSDTITKFVNAQANAALGTQASMIGKTITFTPTADSTSDGSPQTGVVTAISVKDGAFTYLVNGLSVDPKSITQIETAPQPATPLSSGGA